MEKSDIWQKYRRDSKQTICIIGVLILASKLCIADGHFSEEEEEILRIIPHEPHQRRILIRILEEGAKDLNSISYHAQRIKNLIGDDNKEFLEFIIAVLFKLANVDHIYHVNEDEAIREVASVFGITKTYFDVTKITFIKVFKYKYFSK